jgi:hypothetical protein
LRFLSAPGGKANESETESAQQNAGPNAEERGQVLVPMGAWLVRSSSSVSSALGAIAGRHEHTIFTAAVDTGERPRFAPVRCRVACHVLLASRRFHISFADTVFLHVSSFGGNWSAWQSGLLIAFYLGDAALSAFLEDDSRICPSEAMLRPLLICDITRHD